MKKHWHIIDDIYSWGLDLRNYDCFASWMICIDWHRNEGFIFPFLLPSKPPERTFNNGRILSNGPVRFCAPTITQVFQRQAYLPRTMINHWYITVRRLLLNVFYIDWSSWRRIHFISCCVCGTAGKICTAPCCNLICFFNYKTCYFSWYGVHWIMPATVEVLMWRGWYVSESMKLQGTVVIGGGSTCWLSFHLLANAAYRYDITV